MDEFNDVSCERNAWGLAIPGVGADASLRYQGRDRSNRATCLRSSLIANTADRRSIVSLTGTASLCQCGTAGTCPTLPVYRSRTAVLRPSQTFAA